MKFKKLLKMKHLPQIGRTPSFDWFILLSFFTMLIVIIAAYSVLEFLSVKKSLNASTEMPSDTRTNVVAKTKEEQARELIQKYQAQKNRHLSLLAKTKPDIIVPVPAATSTATSTASSTVRVSPAPSASSVSSASPSTASTTAPSAAGTGGAANR